VTGPRHAPVLLGAEVVVAVTLLFGALLYRSARGSSHEAARNAGPAGSRLTAPLPIIWPRHATWPRSLRPALRSGTLRLADLRGHPVVLNFFASWCDPCNREAGVLSAAARRARTRVVFLGADVNDYRPAARRFLRVHRVPFAAVRPGSRMVKAFGLIGLPETFYLDRRGHVVVVTRGELTHAALARDLRRLAAR
jgi:cytochrome c biogenesis protein CcmG/thiol:disulfide interchange protein DsbE